ncbi:hypothetical protein [Acidithiobacillus acidisediminis]|uniref:hypothetical protein n=1 Tax=Acidithiobacillus acidisediminis TaxID=2937799 RepID=UPI00200E1734|nr:hypothetical protein [Acidithiobacillus sp. S30A2]
MILADVSIYDASLVHRVPVLSANDLTNTPMQSRCPSWGDFSLPSFLVDARIEVMRAIQDLCSTGVVVSPRLIGLRLIYGQE